MYFDSDGNAVTGVATHVTPDWAWNDPASIAMGFAPNSMRFTFDENGVLDFTSGYHGFHEDRVFLDGASRSGFFWIGEGSGLNGANQVSYFSASFHDFMVRNSGTVYVIDATLRSWILEYLQFALNTNWLPDGGNATFHFDESGALIRISVNYHAPPVVVDGIILTISMEETVLPQGEDFRVNVELKNNTEEDHEIAFSILFWPFIQDWHLFDEWGAIDLPYPGDQRKVFKANSTISNTGPFGTEIGWYFGHTLETGTHEIRFRADFYLNWHKENHRRVEIWSNEITFVIV